jgi:hypothetical protein
VFLNALFAEELEVCRRGYAPRFVGHRHEVGHVAMRFGGRKEGGELLVRFVGDGLGRCAGISWKRCGCGLYFGEDM